jgi:[acyl-carrier-protein] S-malonyltransferase
MTKTAWIFPGQGSQAVNMGIDLKDIPAAKEKFDRSEKILGWSVLEMCQGDEEQLSRTIYTQPCLYVIESLLADLLMKKGHSPDFVAGHSLGEYIALYAAGVFDFETGLQLVKHRAELMDAAAGGKMVALMKFDRALLEKAMKTTPDVAIANDNSTEQVVISGTPEAVEFLLSQVSAKRVVPLKVSGAFHSHLMAPAAQQFHEVLDAATFDDAKVPILANVDPTPSVKGAEIKARLVRQMTGAVRWREIMLQLPEQGVSQAVEVGPGKVLTGLLKRTCPNIALKNISSVADIG